MSPLTKYGVGKLPAVRKPLTPRKFMACICVVLRSPLVMSCRAVETDGAKGFSLLRCSVVVLPSDKDLVFASGIETPAPPSLPTGPLLPFCDAALLMSNSRQVSVFQNFFAADFSTI